MCVCLRGENSYAIALCCLAAANALIPFLLSVRVCVRFCVCVCMRKIDAVRMRVRETFQYDSRS